jgi:ribosomal protein L40E
VFVHHIIFSVGRRARIKKKVFPHLFRHSRATYLANFLTEAQMKEVFGWVQASDMAAIYVHLSGRNVDNATRKAYGIETKENKKESTLKLKVCDRCQAQNVCSNIFCSRCGYALDESTRMGIMKKELDRDRADNVLDQLVKDQQFRELFIKKLKELKVA